MPSFSFILIGAERFDRLRAKSVRAFLNGAGPAAIGAIAGDAIPLALALGETWQLAVLAAAIAPPPAEPARSYGAEGRAVPKCRRLLVRSAGLTPRSIGRPACA